MSTYHNPIYEWHTQAQPCQRWECEDASILVKDDLTGLGLLYCSKHLPKDWEECSFHTYAEADGLYQLVARFPSTSLSDVLNPSPCWNHPNNDGDAIGCGISGPGFVDFCWDCIQPNRKEYEFSMWWPIQVNRDDAIRLAKLDGFWE